MAKVRRLVQRRAAEAVGGLERRAAVEESLDLGAYARDHGLVQRRVAVPVARVHVRAQREQYESQHGAVKPSHLVF